MLLSILMARLMRPHFSTQEQDALKHANHKCHLCAFLVNL